MGWVTPETIADTETSKWIDPSPSHYYFVEGRDGSEFIVEFRTAEGFGQYTNWYHFTKAPGLLIWKRMESTDWAPQLIAADNRNIFNAMLRPIKGTRRTWDSSFAYPWMDSISDPFGAEEGNGLEATIRSAGVYKNPPDPANPPTLASTIRLDGSTHRDTPDWASDATHLTRDLAGVNEESLSHVAFRNIHVVRSGEDGHALVNIYRNYWEGPISVDTEWTGEVYVGADIEIEDGATLTVSSGAVVHFLSPRGNDGNSSTNSELVVESGGILKVSSGTVFRSAREPDNSASDLTKARESHGIWVQSRGAAFIDGLTIADGVHYLYAHASAHLYESSS